MDDVRPEARPGFRRGAGGFEPRHFFLADWLAIIVAVLVPMLISIVILLVIGGVVVIAEDDDASPAPVVAEAGF